MSQALDLKPCPFCGGAPKKSFRSGVTGRACRSKWFRGQIRCSSCEATGPLKANPQDAINSWNSRELVAIVPSAPSHRASNKG